MQLEKLRLQIKDIQPKVVQLKSKQAEIKKLENKISNSNLTGLDRISSKYYSILDKYYSLVLFYGSTDHEHRRYKNSNNFTMKQYKYLVTYAKENLTDNIELDQYYNILVNGEPLQAIEVSSSANTINHLDPSAQLRIAKGLLNNLVIEHFQTSEYNTRYEPVKNTASEIQYLDNHNYEGDLNWIAIKYYALITGHNKLKFLLKGAKEFNVKLKENYKNLVDYMDAELDEEIKIDYHGFLVINNERVLLP